MPPRYLQERALTLPQKVSRVAEAILEGAAEASGGSLARGAPAPAVGPLDEAARELLTHPRSEPVEVSPDEKAALVEALTPGVVRWLWDEMVSAEVIEQEAARSTTVREDVGGRVIITRLSATEHGYSRRTPLELLVQGLAMAMIDPVPDEPKPHGLT